MSANGNRQTSSRRSTGNINAPKVSSSKLPVQAQIINPRSNKAQITSDIFQSMAGIANTVVQHQAETKRRKGTALGAQAAAEGRELTEQEQKNNFAVQAHMNIMFDSELVFLEEDAEERIDSLLSSDRQPTLEEVNMAINGVFKDFMSNDDDQLDLDQFNAEEKTNGLVLKKWTLPSRLID